MVDVKTLTNEQIDESIVDLKKWISALKSGKYKQSRHSLHRKFDDTYCCLGVACRIGITTESTRLFPRNFSIIEFEDMRELSIMNDEEKKSFPEIADHIEKEYLTKLKEERTRRKA